MGGDVGVDLVPTSDKVMLDFKRCTEDAPAGRKVRGIDACLSKTEGARGPRALMCLDAWSIDDGTEGRPTGQRATPR